MPTVLIPEQELVDQLQQIAVDKATSMAAMLGQAITEFLENYAVQKLQEETRAFEQLHPQLVEHYLGEYVAVHNGAVVDHDPDVRALHLRIRKRFVQTPILFRQVSKEVALPEFTVRSPKVLF